MSYWRLFKRYFTPRRIRIKALLIYTVTFVLLIILIDDYLNTNNDPVSKLAQKKEMDAANTLYKRDRFVKHPKDIRIPNKYLDEDTQVDELAVTDKSKNIGNSENLINVQVSNEFELPKLNMDRLLSDSKYKESIKAALFDDIDDVSTLGGDTNSIKECDCFNVQMCKCCLHLNLTSIDFLHYSCAYLTYEKGSKDFSIDIKLNDNELIYSDKFQVKSKNQPTVCLNAVNSKYCIGFTKYIYHRRTVAGCLNAKFELNKLDPTLDKKNAILVNKNIGCFKLPFNTKLTWKDILTSNKTVENFQNMNQNGWIV